MGWSPTDKQWGQASRGFWCGGLGLREAAVHAAPAYLASRLVITKLCQELDLTFPWEGANAGSALGKALHSYNAAVRDQDQLNLDTEPSAPPRQQTLSRAVDQHAHTEFLNGLCDSDRRSLLSELLPVASGFLQAPPSKERGLAWDPTEFVTEVRTRLLADLYPEDTWCPACDAVLDKKGRHPGVCAAGGD